MHLSLTLAVADLQRSEDFYREIARRHPDGDAVVVEAPWHLESFSNPINLQQDIHGQSVLIGFVNGTCAGPLPGELKAGQPGMKFRNFVYLSDLLDGGRKADYLVLRRRGLKESARKIEMDFATCEKLLRERFGSPMWETDDALVFLLSGNNRRGNAD